MDTCVETPGCKKLHGNDWNMNVMDGIYAYMSSPVLSQGADTKHCSQARWPLQVESRDTCVLLQTEHNSVFIQNTVVLYRIHLVEWL